MTTVLKKIFVVVQSGIAGAIITLLVQFVLYVNNKPDLEIWDTVVPDPACC
jgi:hypothetical protein